jgi:deoxyribonuclease (pyrimidine dimer)
MTRINLVPPAELSGPHLVAEYRESVRIFALARKAQHELHKRKIPNEYTLGTGHCMFFVPRLAFITERYDALCAEMQARGYQCNRIAKEALHEGIKPSLFRGYIPTEQAISINRQRIEQRTQEANERNRHKREAKGK